MLTLYVSDKLLWYLTQFITDVQEVMEVGTNLGVSEHRIRAILTNHPRDIR